MKINLDDINKNEPFKAPEGYFDSLADRIMDRIEEEEMPAKKHFSLAPWIKYSAAACIVLMVTAGIFFLNLPQDPTASELLAEVSDEAILEYLADADITTEEILEITYFEEEEIESIQEEALPQFDIETLDSILDELDFNEQDINTL